MKYPVLFITTITLQLFACTGIQLHDINNSPVNGRTVEFGMELEMSIAVIPRNRQFTSMTPVGPGKSYTAKYAAVGAYCFDLPVLMDGMNEMGLSAGAFYFPGYAGYTKVSRRNRAYALSPVDFLNWILTQFATLEEVKAGLKHIVITGTGYKGFNNGLPPPMHYIVYDKSGKSIVIEPVEGSLKVYDNALGSITNSPSFDWHLTNLNNYINLNPRNVEEDSIGKLKLKPFGQGTGMLGLPGDFTPPSRFIRATFYSQASIPAPNSEAAVKEAFHILNQFDIPKGSVKEENGPKSTYDYTMLTTVKDPTTLKYYYRSYENQNIECIDLKTFNLRGSEIKAMKVESKQKIRNASEDLKTLEEKQS